MYLCRDRTEESHFFVGVGAALAAIVGFITEDQFAPVVGVFALTAGKLGFSRD